MSKASWKKHVALRGPHSPLGCVECAKRLATKRAGERARSREAILRLTGLKKVRGARGGVYWE